MYRTNTCGELGIKNAGQEVTLCGWVHKSRDLGGMTFVDLRDRYGITQLVFNMEADRELCELARRLGREFVIQAKGKVRERSNKNMKIPTGEIEIEVSEFKILNKSEIPPFTIEEDTDGGEELRMKYRYLDLRRYPVMNNIILRHRVAREVRSYMDSIGFIEVETPVLIKSTPEGARDFVVPSRMQPGTFYALPQSPQTLKQLLMVAGFDTRCHCEKPGESGDPPGDEATSQRIAASLPQNPIITASFSRPWSLRCSFTSISAGVKHGRCSPTRRPLSQTFVPYLALWILSIATSGIAP